MLCLRNFGGWAHVGFPTPVVRSISVQSITGHHRLLKSCLYGPSVSNFGGRKKLTSAFGLHSASRGEFLPLFGSSRPFSGGKQKSGETAKQKRMRRMLKKLNYVTEEDTPSMETTSDWQSKDLQQQRRGERGGEKDRGYDSKKTEAEAEAAVAAAQQQMNRHLHNLSVCLKDLDVARPKISTFEEIKVQAAGRNKPLSDLAQVQIKGNSVVILTLFSEQHLSKVISALRREDENWRIVEEGPVTVRVQLPKMTEELRASFTAQAKAATEECKVRIRRVRQDTRAKHRSLFKDSRTCEDTRKNEEQQLQKITDDAIKQATQFLADKLRQLAAASC